MTWHVAVNPLLQKKSADKVPFSSGPTRLSSQISEPIAEKKEIQVHLLKEKNTRTFRDSYMGKQPVYVC